MYYNYKDIFKEYKDYIINAIESYDNKLLWHNFDWVCDNTINYFDIDYDWRKLEIDLAAKLASRYDGEDLENFAREGLGKVLQVCLQRLVLDIFWYLRKHNLIESYQVTLYLLDNPAEIDDQELAELTVKRDQIERELNERLDNLTIEDLDGKAK